MRRLALVLIVLALPLLAWAGPGGYPSRGQPLRGVPDRGQPAAPSGSSPTPVAQRTTSTLTALGFFGMIQDVLGGLLRSWSTAIDSVRAWIQGLPALAFGGLTLGLVGGVYGIRRYRRWKDRGED